MCFVRLSMISRRRGSGVFLKRRRTSAVMSSSVVKRVFIAGDVAMVLSLVEGRELGVHVDPDRLGVGVIVHRFETHFASVARLSHAAERRSGVDALVAVDPHHSGIDGGGDA